ncbi:alkaline phosphatase family protein [Candidatus Roseilinea sp. NK_OTU-006]|uniref:alkaline phosphatase family protein n=1 Tax=Candidatus Roseilinea sp. NK_OTU-006 TaxID=2704250 RepID=UPI00145F6B2F|nr:alkaline phosphatase family protein [Candidatus Roseilinea sp. NK_OTU-006]
MCNQRVNTKILLIGLDGADQNVLGRFAEQGDMPFLRESFAQAPLRALESIPPYATPAAWASIYTGLTPAEHGVLDFLDLIAGENQLVSSASLRAEPIWRRLSSHGRRVAMIGFPLTYPAVPVNGVMVSGLPAPHQKAIWSWPAEFDAHLKAIPHFLPDPEMTSPRVKPVRSMLGLQHHVRAVVEAALAAHEHYGESGWDLFGVQFQALDTFQHMFWAWIDPTDHRFHTYPEHERQGAAGFFRVLDEALRRLVQKLQPNHIVILSDHGFGPAYQAVCPNHLLLERGLLTPSVSLAQLHRSFHIQRLLKRLDVLNLRARVKFSARPGTTIMGLNRLMRDSLIDREKTPAYVFSGGYCGLVKVRPGFERAVQDALLQARHPTLGNRLIKSVHFLDTLWNGQWSDAWRQLAIIQAEAGFLIDSHFREYGAVAPVSAGLTGTHRPTGILWTTLNTLDAATSVLDIAPGVLRALNLPFPEERGDTAQAKVESTATFSTEDQSAIEERLRQLGYL